MSQPTAAKLDGSKKRSCHICTTYTYIYSEVWPQRCAHQKPLHKQLTKTTNEIKNCQKDFYWLLMLLLTDRHYTNRLWVITTVQTLCNNAPTHRLTIVALHLGGLWLSFAIAPPLLDHRLAGDAASVLLIALQQVQLCWCACAFVVRVTMCRCVGFIALMSQHRT